MINHHNRGRGGFGNRGKNTNKDKLIKFTTNNVFW